MATQQRLVPGFGRSLIFQLLIHKRRPANVDKNTLYCHRCGRRDTPEWRKGPSGPATCVLAIKLFGLICVRLCNACGLQWAKKHKYRSPFCPWLPSDEEFRRTAPSPPSSPPSSPESPPSHPGNLERQLQFANLRGTQIPPRTPLVWHSEQKIRRQQEELQRRLRTMSQILSVASTPIEVSQAYSRMIGAAV